MSQRGVTGSMVEMVMNHGAIEKDRYVLGRRQAQELLKKLQEEERIIKKIIDKGGVTVVSDEDVLITTYNCTR